MVCSLYSVCSPYHKITRMTRRVMRIAPMKAAVIPMILFQEFEYEMVSSTASIDGGGKKASS